MLGTREFSKPGCLKALNASNWSLWVQEKAGRFPPVLARGVEVLELGHRMRDALRLAPQKLQPLELLGEKVWGLGEEKGSGTYAAKVGNTPKII